MRRQLQARAQQNSLGWGWGGVGAGGCTPGQMLPSNFRQGSPATLGLGCSHPPQPSGT